MNEDMDDRAEQNKKSSRRKPEKVFLNDKGERNMELILSSDVLVNTAQIRLLGLEELQEKSGDEWSAQCELIHSTLIDIVVGSISSKDAFYRKFDDEFIVVYSSFSDMSAKLVSGEILQKLNEKFSGVAETKNVVAAVTVIKINGEIICSPEELQKMLDHFENEKKPDDWRNTSKSSPRPILQDEYIFGFAPVWDAKNQVITSYFVNACTNIDANTDGKLRLKKVGYHVLANMGTLADRIKLDRLTLTSSVERLKELGKNDSRAVFTIPLSYETVFNRDLLREYAAHCKIISPSLKKYIVFSLINFPTGIPAVKLDFIVSTLKNLGGDVVLMTRSADVDFEKYKDAGIRVLGTNISDHGRKRSRAWERLQLFITRCQQNKVRIALLDVSSEDDLRLAKSAGVDYMTGQAIGGYKEATEQMRRLPWQQLIGRF